MIKALIFMNFFCLHWLGALAIRRPARYCALARLSYYDDGLNPCANNLDTAGRLVSASSPVVGAIAYANDNDGHRTGMTWPDGYGVSYAYDAANRLTAIAENGGPVLAAYGFDGASRRNGLIAGNGVQTGYVYAANDDLTGLTHGFTGGTASLGYGYDGTHRRTSQAVSDSGFVGHPAAGGALTYGANALDQYDAVGQSAYLYDGNGNLANDRSLTYQYDTENRLIAAAKPGHAYSYVYDPLGRSETTMSPDAYHPRRTFACNIPLLHNADIRQPNATYNILI